MDGVTRRQAIAIAGVPVVTGLASYAAASAGLLPGGGAPRFAPAGPNAARDRIQREHLPNVPLVTQDGDRVRFYDDLVKDRKVVLTFMSTGAVPASTTVTENLAKLQRFFGARVGRDMFLYSISRTPERDTPAVLRDWATQHGAGPGWTFLTGRPADVEALRRALGFVSPDPVEDADPVYAIGQLRHGVEPEMRWAHCQALASPRVIAHALLLDFGAGPVVPGAVPPWNCSLALAALA
jgi:protein SCO1/2